MTLTKSIQIHPFSSGLLTKSPFRSLLRFLFRIARPATAATAPSVAVCDDVDVVAVAAGRAEVAGEAVTAVAGAVALGRTKFRAMVAGMGCS